MTPDGRPGAPRSRLRLGAAIALQLAILAAVPWRQVSAALRGQELTLATAPVDPFDAFTGPYVALAYEVEARPRGAVEAREGQLVYVVVERGAPAWRLVEVSATRPDPAPGRLALRATWHRGRPALESAGRLYLTQERATEIEAAMRAPREAQARDLEAALRAWRAVKAEGGDPGPMPERRPLPPEARPLVDLMADQDGNLQLRRIRIGDRSWAVE